MEIKVEIKGLEELRKALKDLKNLPRVKAEVGTSALEIQSAAKRNLKTAGSIDTGNARNTTIVEFDLNGCSAEIGTVAPYGPYIEFGTRPHFPPPDALEAWARHHGFDSAWPICIAIAKRGLRARPYLLPAYDEVAPKFEKRLAEVYK